MLRLRNSDTTIAQAQHETKKSGQVQNQPCCPIWPKRLVLENIFPTPRVTHQPALTKSPSGFRSAYGRGYHLLPTYRSQSDAIGLKKINVRKCHFQSETKQLAVTKTRFRGEDEFQNRTRRQFWHQRTKPRLVIYVLLLRNSRKGSSLTPTSGWVCVSPLL